MNEWTPNERIDRVRVYIYGFFPFCRVQCFLAFVDIDYSINRIHFQSVHLYGLLKEDVQPIFYVVIHCIILKNRIDHQSYGAAGHKQFFDFSFRIFPLSPLLWVSRKNFRRFLLCVCVCVYSVDIFMALYLRDACTRVRRPQWNSLHSYQALSVIKFIWLCYKRLFSGCLLYYYCFSPIVM